MTIHLQNYKEGTITKNTDGSFNYVVRSVTVGTYPSIQALVDDQEGDHDENSQPKTKTTTRKRRPVAKTHSGDAAPESSTKATE